MKKLKKIFFALILGFISISIINAAEVAKIGDTKYGTIDEAISAATSGQEIDLLSDLTQLTVGKDKSVVINLSGHKVEKVVNEGTLTLNGEGKVLAHSMADGITNKEGADLTIDENVEFETESISHWSIVNEGTVTIHSANFVHNAEKNNFNKHIYNKENGIFSIWDVDIIGHKLFVNEGIMTIVDGFFEAVNNTDSNENYGILSIVSGTFKSSSKQFIANKSGELGIHGGLFNVQSVACNETLDLTDYSSGSIVIDDGEFNTTGTAFCNSSLVQNASIEIKGGTISSNTTDPVIAEHSGHESNVIRITGGEIFARNSSGFLLKSDGKFVVGTNDDKVSTESPLIEITQGSISGLGVPTFEFYDGEIILSKKIILSSHKLITPDEYDMRYDENEDDTYTAYLSKISNSVDDNTQINDTDEVDKEQIDIPKDNASKDNNIKNPETGIYYGYGVLAVIIAIGIVVYAFIRKRSKFPKHN